MYFYYCCNFFAFSFSIFTNEQNIIILDNKIGAFSAGDIVVDSYIGETETYLKRSQGAYLATIECDNNESNITWSNKLWGVVIKDMNETTCSIKYSKNNTPTYLNDEIIRLYGVSGQSEIEYTNNHEYRYVGSEPNNYIWFNNELWRIIGVFDSYSTGESGMLTKIIRNESIGGIPYDFDGKTYKNDWAVSTSKTLLNTYYYNSIKEYNGIPSSEYCHIDIDGTTSTIACNFENRGIKDGYRDMIQEVTWYLGSWKTGTYANAYYVDEKDPESVREGNHATTRAYIGMIYASDFGFASGNRCTSNNTSINNYISYYDAYFTDYCRKNWLYKSGYMWTITHYSKSSGSVFYIDNKTVNRNVASYTDNSYSIKPTLYLKEKTYVISGNGTKGNPFIIGMDNN